jgi:hypothetical protein
VRFWIDPWLNDTPLIESFPAFFDICQGQDWMFEKVIDSGMDVSFRRRMPPAMAAQWEHIKTCALAHPSSSVADGVSWSLNINGRFSTKSMYQYLERSLAGSHNKWIWKAKLPLKIKVFMWQLFQIAILTRDNLKKRKWPGSPLYSFCAQHESARHLFFECSNAKVVWGTLGGILGSNLCPLSLWQSIAWLYRFYSKGKRFHMFLLAAICWGIWNVRNKITFDHVMVRSPLVSIATICSFMHSWAGLYGAEDGDKIKAGADQILQRASALHAETPLAPPTPSAGQNVLMITNGGS